MITSHAVLAPHLPTLLVDEHRRHRTEMLAALAEAAERFAASRPEAIVALSARWTPPGSFLVDGGRRHGTLTDYPGFGVEVRYDCAGHPALARALVEAGRAARLPVGTATRGVDSGVSVPLHFLMPSRAVPVVPLAVARRSVEECRRWGATLRRALAARAERVAFVVGGLISFDPHAWSLRREVPEARELDRRVLEGLEQGRWDEIDAAGRALGEKARPEADLRHLEVLGGFLGGAARGELRCYEPGPGVGAALVEFPVAEPIEAATRV